MVQLKFSKESNGFLWLVTVAVGLILFACGVAAYSLLTKETPEWDKAAAAIGVVATGLLGLGNAWVAKKKEASDSAAVWVDFGYTIHPERNDGSFCLACRFENRGTRPVHFISLTLVRRLSQDNRVNPNIYDVTTKTKTLEYENLDYLLSPQRHVVFYWEKVDRTQVEFALITGIEVVFEVGGKHFLRYVDRVIANQ